MYIEGNIEDFDDVNEQKELHDTLKELKNKHDVIFESCRKKERDIEGMNIQIEKIRANESSLKQNEDNIAVKLGSTKEELDDIEQRLAEAMATKKSYEYMLKRMKKDELIHQKNSFNVEKSLKLGKVRLSRNKEALIHTRRED